MKVIRSPLKMKREDDRERRRTWSQGKRRGIMCRLNETAKEREKKREEIVS